MELVEEWIAINTYTIVFSGTQLVPINFQAAARWQVIYAKGVWT